MKKEQSFSLLQRVLAFALVFVMVAGYVPVTASADQIMPITTVADPETLGRPEAVYGSNTLNAGKITVGKSVQDSDETLGTTEITREDSDNFLVTVSQTAQVAGLASESAVPVDVVFVLDTSNSMSGTKVTTMISAANGAIKSLMEANPNNRVAVVAFSGPDGGGNSGGASASVLTQLGSYEAYENHIQWVDSNGQTSGNRSYIMGRGTGAGIRAGTSTGTNIHAGVALGGKILATEQDTTVVVDGVKVKRMPFLVVMSDGAPTYAADGNWYDPDLTDELGTVREYDGLGFLAALTAAYYKGKITENYFGTNANQDNRCFVYTMGLQLQADGLAEMTMDPANATSSNSEYDSFEDYWADYKAGETSENDDYSFTVKVSSSKTYTITKASIDLTSKYVNGTGLGYTGGYKYNDAYYSVSQANELYDAFNNIVQLIAEKSISSPTAVTTTPEFSGYVTFTDPIGEFMEVKDMKGIYANGRLYAGGRAADYLNGTYTEGSADFFATLRTVLKERLTMTASQNVDSLVSSLISGRQSNQFIRDNSITWWGSKIAGSDESHVQCLGYADMTTDSMTQYIQNLDTIPTFDGITPDTLCRSYLFYGTASGSLSESQSNHDYMYFMVRIQQDLTAPYQQTVVISAPARLLSVDEVMITENEDGATAKIVRDDEPTRVIYEVGLRSDINPQNVKTVVETEMSDYAEEVGNVDANGNYLFYTNDWDRTASEASHQRAMAKATFNAAQDNPFYAYQEDTPILVKNADGTYSQYTGDSAPVGEYYYAQTYYDWDGVTANADGTYNAVKKTAYIRISLAAGETAIDQDTNGWYVKKGTYTAHSLIANGEDVMKTANNTGSAIIVSHPHKTDSGSDSHYTVLLGNNGRLAMPYDPPKSVFKTDAANGTLVESDGRAVAPGETLTYQIEVANTKDAAATAQVIDYIPEGSTYVDGSAIPAAELKTDGSGKQYLEWNNLSVAANSTTTVSFKVTVNADVIQQGVSSINNAATVSLDNEYAYTTNTTTNPPEGKSSATADNDGKPLEEGDVLKVGDQLTYTIRYANDSDAAATVTITDVIPAGTTFSNATENGTYNAETNTVTWTMENVPAGLGGTVSFTVYVNASAKIDPSAAIQPATGNILFENTAAIKVGTNDPRYTNKTKDIGGVGDIALTKAITGIDSTNDVFTLILSDSASKLSGTYVLTGSSAGATSVTFTNGIGRVQLKAGDTVTVKGLPLGTAIAVTEDMEGMSQWQDSYDKTSIVVTAKTDATAVDITVTNEFIIIPVTFQLSAVKKFLGTFPEGSYTFGFKAQQLDDNGDVIEGGREVVATATKGADNSDVSFTFSPRTFNGPTGPLYYLITEDAPQNAGVIGDDTQYLLKLVVEYEVVNGRTTSNLIAKTWYKEVGVHTEWQSFDWKTTSPIEFENNYPADVTTQITGTKTLEGRFVTNGEFSFELLDSLDPARVIANTAVVADGTSNTGTFAFPRTYSITDLIVDGQLQKERTFTYYIREINKGEEGMTYSEAVYQVDVVLKLENGVLTATPSAAKTVAFTNVFEPEEVSVHLYTSKTVEGDHTLKTGEFTFSVYEADSEGNITGSNPVASGSNDGNGDVDLGLLEYVPADLKDASGNYVESKTFHYVLVENIPASYAPTFDPGMFYDETKQTFSVTVSIVDGKMSAEVDDADPKDGAENGYVLGGFTNYRVSRQTSVTPMAQKTTTGTTLPENLRFSFAVRPAVVERGVVTSYSGAAATGVSQSAINDTAVKVDFAKLFYDDSHLGGKNSVTFYYVIEESNAAATNGVTYDQTKYVMQVVLSRKADTKELKTDVSYYLLAEDGTFTTAVDTPSFNNKYDADASVNVDATKVLEGRTLKDREFDFRLQRLKLVDGSYVPVEGSAINGRNDENGDITFGTINFRGTDLVKESTPEFEYVVVTEEVPVETTPAEPSESSEPATETVVKEEYWLVRYQMSEIKPNDVPLAGIDYDKTTHTVTIKLYYEVSDEGNTSTLKAEWIDEPEQTGIVFTNKYAPQNEAQVTISAVKTMTGRTLRDGEFAFNLYRVDDSGNEHFAAGAKNDAAGKVSFTRVYNPSVLDIPAGGSYTVVYHLTETDPTTGGVSKVSGDYYVKVVISHDDDSASYTVSEPTYWLDRGCTKPAGTVEFVNQYIPAGTSFTPAAAKELLDKDNNKLAITENQFSFTVKEVSADGKSVLNAAAGTGNSGACAAGETAAAAFTPITISTAGDHYYEIAEVAVTNAVITYTDSKYYIKANVVDDSNGKLNVGSVTYHSGIPCTAENQIAVNDVCFTNHQGNGEVNLHLDINKTVHVHNSAGNYVEVYKLSGGEFDFDIYEADDNGTITNATPVASGTNGAAGENGIADIIFENLVITQEQFNQADTDGDGTHVFTFVVKEIQPRNSVADGTEPVITIDETPIVIKVTVEKDDYKNLSVRDVEYRKDSDGSGDSNLFVNIFRYKPAKLSLAGKKSLNGKKLAGGEFRFELSGGNLAEPVVKTNGADGTIDFGQLPEFIQPGTFVYTVRELGAADPNENGTYQTDSKIYTVVVTVTTDAEGQLHAVPMYYTNYGDLEKQAAVGGITFTNLYTPNPVSVDLNAAIDIIKTITDESGRPMTLPLDGFCFELVGIVDEDGKTITGITDDKGVIDFPEITFSEAASYIFYIRESAPQTDKPGYVMDPNAWMVEVNVSYNGGLTSVDYTDVTGAAATAGSGQLYIQQGNVKVVSAAAAQEVAQAASVMTAAEAKPVVTFTNVYKPQSGEAVIEATKSLTGRDLRDSEFTFRLMEGERIVAEATNTASGSVTFRVRYTGADMDGAMDGSKTFTYKIVEVAGNAGGVSYDSEEKTVTVTVTDKNGELDAHVSGSSGESFTNTYTAEPAEAEIKAVKYLEGRDLMANMFTFVLSGNGETYEAQNAADGSVTFDPIEYTEAGVYEYTLSEKLPVTRAAGEMTYDDSIYTVTVTVTDDLNGKLHAVTSYSAVPEFHNSYEGIGDFATIAAKKTLSTESNRTMKAGDFTFELVDADGKVVQTKKNDANGDVIFDAIPFETEGTFSYTIREVEGTEEGMTYDKTPCDVTVNVIRLPEGDFKATVVYEGGEVPTFTNTYVSKPIDVTLEASKVLEGRTLKADDFTFELYEGDKKLQTKKNAADGSITFDAITYTASGEYTYIMKEAAGSDKKMDYDTNAYTVTVKVTDTDGVLSADVAYQNDGIEFRNTYNGDPAKASIGARKRLDTDSLRLLKSGEFSFQLLDEDGKVLQTKTNTIFGNVNFDEITYTSEGTFQYTVKEVPGTESGMTYDKTEYKVVVTVTKDMATGNYKAAVEYKTEDGQEPIFVNTFKPLSVKVNLTSQKKLYGRTLKDDDFKFTVYDSNGKKQATGTNDADGEITFSDLTFSQAGVYKFTVKENNGLKLYTTYDKKSYEVTVTVTETDGVLKAEVTYPKDGITFKNYYNPSGDILPKTGDETPLMLLMAVAATSAAGLAMMFIFWRKRRNRQA